MGAFTSLISFAHAYAVDRETIMIQQGDFSDYNTVLDSCALQTGCWIDGWRRRCWLWQNEGQRQGCIVQGGEICEEANVHNARGKSRAVSSSSTSGERSGSDSRGSLSTTANEYERRPIGYARRRGCWTLRGYGCRRTRSSRAIGSRTVDSRSRG